MATKICKHFELYSTLFWSLKTGESLTKSTKYYFSFKKSSTNLFSVSQFIKNNCTQDFFTHTQNHHTYAQPSKPVSCSKKQINWKYTTPYVGKYNTRNLEIKVVHFLYLEVTFLHKPNSCTVHNTTYVYICTSDYTEEN